jgi:hypothetical protein
MAQFWGVQCKSCGAVFEIAEVIEPGVKHPPWSNPAHSQQKRCPMCKKWNTYSPDDIESDPLVGPDKGG